MTGTYIPREPDICACRMNMEETVFHCRGCGRWKPSRQEFCSRCAPALPLAEPVDDIEAYFRTEVRG